MRERVSRRKFIRLGALGAAAASVLAACGGGDDSGGYQAGGANGSGDDGGSTAPSTEASGGGSTGEAASGEHPIASASELEAGAATKFKDAGSPAVLVHLENGDFVAYSAVCTHQQCTVDYRGGELTCPCHGSIFDPANGAEVVSGPAQRPLPEIPVEVRDGEVYKA